MVAMGKGDDPNCAGAAAMPQPEPLSDRARLALRDPAAARDLVLSRGEFRAAVFARDGYRCVICQRPGGRVGLDAHHLMERRLFGAEDPRPGGYVLSNGVAVCDQPHPDGSPSCHMQAEMTLISPARLRAAAGIADTVLPDHLDEGADFTKWGDEVMRDGRRYRGELFFEEPVQKVLREADQLGLYVPSYKQARTFHLPWSPGATSDDKVLADTSFFEGKEIVISEKLDGESVTASRDIMHARSIDSGHHPSRNRAKQLWATIRYDIPEGWRLVCENVTARHHVAYDRLPGFVLVHAIFNERNEALPWDEVEEWSALLGLPTVPVIYRGPWDEEKIRGLYPFQSAFADAPAEGYVVRIADSFRYGDFRRAVGKYVASDFRDALLNTEAHWMHAEMVENQLAAPGDHEQT